MNTYPNLAYHILCEVIRRYIIQVYSHTVVIQAYHRGIYLPKYAWIFPMWYNDNWWINTASENTSCNPNILLQVINGSIGVLPEGYFIMENKSMRTFSGLVSR